MHDSETAQRIRSSRAELRIAVHRLARVLLTRRLASRRMQARLLSTAGMMMQSGDVLIRSFDSQYALLDAESLKTLDGPFSTFADTLAAAIGLVKAGGSIWQENTDNRGRVLGPPTRLV